MLVYYFLISHKYKDISDFTALSALYSYYPYTSSNVIFYLQLILPFVPLFSINLSYLFSINYIILGYFFLYSIISSNPFKDMSRLLYNFCTFCEGSTYWKFILTKFGTSFYSDLLMKFRPMSIDGGSSGWFTYMLMVYSSVRSTSIFIYRTNAQNFNVKYISRVCTILDNFLSSICLIFSPSLTLTFPSLNPTTLPLYTSNLFLSISLWY